MSDYWDEAADTVRGAEGAVPCSWPLSCNEVGTGTPTREGNVQSRLFTNVKVTSESPGSVLSVLFAKR